MGFSASHTKTFVGRERELSELRTAFDDAVTGNGRLVMVVGEPGIGKTALCEELARYVEEQGGTTLIGHCYEEGSLSLPYLPFIQAIRSYVVSRPEVEPGVPINPEEDRYRLLNGVTTFLTNASKSRPLSIVLEDLHDADSGTLEMLTYLSGFLSETNALVVGTYRDVEVDRAHPLSGALAELRRASTFARVTLRGLGLEDVRRMMTIVSGQSITEHLAVTVHRQTEGNPLFVQEVAPYLGEEQALATGDSEVELRVPEGVRDVIGKRLSRLSKECNQILAVASVIGREFDLDVLLEVSSLSEDDLYTHIEEAQGASVVEESSGIRGGLSYRFSHAMMRETLYEEIFAPRRIRYHQQVGRAIERIHANRIEEHASELADHFANSSDVDDLTRAVTYGEMAADRALEVYALREAVRLLERAMEVQEIVDPDDKAKRCDLLLKLGMPLTLTLQNARVVQEIAPEALSLAEALGDDARAFQASLVGMRSSWLTTVVAEFEYWVAQGTRYASPGTLDRVLVGRFEGAILIDSGRWDEAWALHQQMDDLARQSGDFDVEAMALFQLLNRGWPLRYRSERFEYAKKVADRSRNEGSLLHLFQTIIGAAVVFLENRERGRAEDLLDEAPELLARMGDFSGPGLEWQMSAVRSLDGRLDEMVSVAKRRVTSGVFGPVGGRLFTRTVLRPLMLLGRSSEVLAVFGVDDEFFKSEPASNEDGYARYLAYAGRRREAAVELRRLLGKYELGLDKNEPPGYFLASMLEAAVLAEDRETATVLERRLAEHADELAIHAIYCSTFARLLGGAAALLGRPDQARAYYIQALEVGASVRFRLDIALTHLQLGELLIESYPAERDEAREHLELALSECREMKMRPSVEKAEGLLAKLHASSQKEAYPDGLSGREVEVLRLIAAGNSNQQIADALFISPSTVAHHVTSILTKTDSSNRAEAATYAGRQGLT